MEFLLSCPHISLANNWEKLYARQDKFRAVLPAYLSGDTKIFLTFYLEISREECSGNGPKIDTKIHLL